MRMLQNWIEQNQQNSSERMKERHGDRKKEKLAVLLLLVFLFRLFSFQIPKFGWKLKTRLGLKYIYKTKTKLCRCIVNWDAKEAIKPTSINMKLRDDHRLKAHQNHGLWSHITKFVWCCRSNTTTTKRLESISHGISNAYDVWAKYQTTQRKYLRRIRTVFNKRNLAGHGLLFQNLPLNSLSHQPRTFQWWTLFSQTNAKLDCLANCIYTLHTHTHSFNDFQIRVRLWFTLDLVPVTKQIPSQSVSL